MKKLLLGLVLGLLVVPAALNVVVFQAERNSKKCMEAANSALKEMAEKREGNPFEVIMNAQACMADAQNSARQAFDVLLFPARMFGGE